MILVHDLIISDPYSNNYRNIIGILMVFYTPWGRAEPLGSLPIWTHVSAVYITNFVLISVSINKVEAWKNFEVQFQSTLTHLPVVGRSLLDTGAPTRWPWWLSYEDAFCAPPDHIPLNSVTTVWSVSLRSRWGTVHRIPPPLSKQRHCSTTEILRHCHHGDSSQSVHDLLRKKDENI